MSASRRVLTTMLAAALMSGSCDDDVTAAPVVSLRFSQQPPGGIAGQPMAFAVAFLDARGSLATSVNEEVTVGVGSGETVSDVRTIRAVDGLVAVNDFVVTSAGTAQVLTATSQGLGAVSLPFVVDPGLADGSKSTVSTTGSQTLLSNTPRTVVFTIADQFGNPIPRADVTVSSDVAGATFTPAGGKTSAQGTFQTMYRPPNTGTARFSAVVNGRSIALAAPLTIGNACASTAVTLPATMSGALVRDQGCIINGNPYQFFQFTTAASGGVSMNISAQFGASLELRADPAVPNVPLGIQSVDVVNRQWLLPAGTYEFRIGASVAQGSYAVAAAAAPANRGDTIRIIALPGTYTGQTLAPGDFLNSVNSFTDVYTLFSTRPCTITVRSTAFDPFITLTSVFGTLIGVDDNSGGGTDAQITRASCTSCGNSIGIQVASVVEGQTGAYTLIITYN